jgi:periplasmic protein TonB
MKAPFTIIMSVLCVLFFPVAGRSQGTGTAAATDSAKNASVDSPSKVFARVEKESQFPGGSPAWLRYLNDHLVYPKKAVRKKIEGTVVLQFIVNKDGSIADLTVLTGDPILAEAAEQAMADCPRWIPAEQYGRKVRSYKKQPIVFKLQAQ